MNAPSLRFGKVNITPWRPDEYRNRSFDVFVTLDGDEYEVGDCYLESPPMQAYAASGGVEAIFGENALDGIGNARQTQARARELFHDLDFTLQRCESCHGLTGSLHSTTHCAHCRRAFTPITVGDWEKCGSRMIWSMYDSSPVDRYYETMQLPGANHTVEMASRMFREAFDAQVLELDAWADARTGERVPDGVYKVFDRDSRRFRFGPGCVLHDQPDPSENNVGAVVVDGRFDPVPTAEAIYRMVCLRHGLPYGSDAFDHRFIEQLAWDRFMPGFAVSLGS